MKDYLIYGAQIIQCVSVSIILVVTKINGSLIRLVEVKLAYIQSDKPLIRKTIISNPAGELKPSPEKFLELLKLIYELVASGNERRRAVDYHVEIDLKRTPTIVNQSLYFLFEDDQRDGINGIYIDDLLRTGTDNWEIYSNDTLIRFETTENQ